MKKWMVIVLALLMLSFVGCVDGGKSAELDEKESQTDSAETTQDSVAQTGSDTDEPTQEIPNQTEENYTKNY